MLIHFVIPALDLNWLHLLLSLLFGLHDFSFFTLLFVQLICIFTFLKYIKAHQVDCKERLTSYCSFVFPTAWSLRLLYINQRIILYLNSFHQVYCTHLDYHHSIRTLSLCAHARGNQSKKARILQIYLLYIFRHSQN